MKIEQRRFSNRTLFEFGDHALKYSVQDKSGRHAFSTDYISIQTNTGELDERNDWFRNAGLLWVILGMTFVAYQYYETGELRGSIFLTLGLLFLLPHRFVKTSFTLIETDKSRIFVIKDDKHDRILRELYGRRKGRLLAEYGNIDFHDDPDNETRKFMWLKSEGVITEQEFQQITTRIRSYHDHEQPAAGDDGSGRMLN